MSEQKWKTQDVSEDKNAIVLQAGTYIYRSGSLPAQQMAITLDELDWEIVLMGMDFAFRNAPGILVPRCQEVLARLYNQIIEQRAGDFPNEGE